MTIHTWKILKSNTVTMKFPYSSYLFISLVSKSSLPLCTLSLWSSNSFVPFPIDPLYCRKTSLSKPNILTWSHHESMRKYSLTWYFYRKKPSMIRFLTSFIKPFHLHLLNKCSLKSWEDLSLPLPLIIKITSNWLLVFIFSSDCHSFIM